MKGNRMPLPKIDGLTYKQLKQLEWQVQRALVVQRATERKAVAEKAQKLAADAGLDLRELIGPSKPARKRPVKKRIYNPANRAESYGGYGPKPKWLKDLEAQKKAA